MVGARVLVDLSYIRSPGEVGGSEHVALGLIDELVRRGRRSEMLLIVNPKGREQLLQRGVTADVTIPITRPGLARWPAAGAATVVNALVRKIPTVFWLGGLAFPPVLGRSVLLIHDIGPIVTDDYPGLRTKLLRFALPVMARRAAHVVTVSEFSRREIIDKLGVDPSNISVIPEPLSAVFDESEPERPHLVPSDLRFMFCLDDGKPHKNVAALVDLYLRNRERLFYGVHLVVAGRASARWHDSDRGMLGLGFVTDGELRYLYEQAEVIVIPSLYEGFGRPVVEALVVGGRVACSNRGSLPEVGGEYVTLFEPTDPESMLQAIVRCIQGVPKGGPGTQDQRKWAARHSWSDVGDVIEKALFEPEP